MRDDVIGRDPELARLAALLDGLPAGGGAVVLRGDAGVGKSTLLDRAAAAAGERGLPTAPRWWCRPTTRSGWTARAGTR